MNNNPTGSPLRSLFMGGGNLLSGLFPAAATYFSPRVSRGLILRISLLLFARAVLAAIPLPVNEYMLNYLFSMVSNVVVSSIGLSAFASYFDFGGPFAALGRRLFKPVDSPFITLYANLVCILGPLLSLIEAAVIVFSAMRFSRNLERRMIVAKDESERTLWRNLILFLSAALYILVSFAAYTSYKMTGGSLRLSVVLFATSFVFFVVAFANDQANVLDAALLAFYSAFLSLCALIEQRDMRNSHVLKYFSHDATPATPETRAVVLVLSVGLSLVAISQMLPLVQIIAFGHDAMAQETVARTQAQHVQPVVNPVGVPALGLQAAGLAPPVRIPNTGTAPLWRDGVLTAVAITAVTFRTLVWTRELKNGEYLPAAARAIQAVATLVVYVCFLKIETDDAEGRERKQKEDAVGKVD